jgi:hypothetical protein
MTDLDKILSVILFIFTWPFTITIVIGLLIVIAVVLYFGFALIIWYYEKLKYWFKRKFIKPKLSPKSKILKRYDVQN